MKSHHLIAQLLALTAAVPLSAAELRQPREHLFTGGQPSAQQLRDVAQSGVTTVIDLRMPQEDAVTTKPLLPSNSACATYACPLPAPPTSTTPMRTLDRLLRQDTNTTLLHCASGNRAGALLALAHARAWRPRRTGAAAWPRCRADVAGTSGT